MSDPISTTSPKTLDKSQSKLHESIGKYGKSSYYYAHTRPSWEVPDHAKVLTGPGIITGGAPVRIADANGGPHIEAPTEEPLIPSLPRSVLKRHWNELPSYTWMDCDATVKIMFDITKMPEGCRGILEQDGKEALVKTTFETSSVRLNIESRITPEEGTVEVFGFAIPSLFKPIVPEECKVTLSPGKRVTMTLKKQDPTFTWRNVKK